MDDVYSVSVGWFQNRALWYPHKWGQLDHVREIYALLNPFYNTIAALRISKGGTDFTPWTVFRSGTWEQFDDKDYTLRSGHVRAGEWRRGILRPAEQIIAEAGQIALLSAGQIATMVNYARTHRSALNIANPIRPT